MSDTSKKTFVWITAAFFLIILSDYLPKFVIYLTLLLIASVLLIHYEDYVKLIKAMQTAIGG
jgi:hypothetical protein